MKKKFPFEKVVNKLDILYQKQEELEREDATSSNPALWQLQDRIMGIEMALEAQGSGDDGNREAGVGARPPYGVAASSLLDK